MADLVYTVLTALWLFLPAYIANMSPVFVGGLGPIDGGRYWSDGRRILGDGKSWGGLLFAPVVAGVLTLVLDWLHSVVPWLEANFPEWGASPLVAFVMAYAFGLGAIVGDATESFFKRRVGKARGEPWIGFDQLDFVVGAFVFGLLFAGALAALGVTSGFWFTDRWTLPRVLVILILTPALHLLVNWIGFKIGKKEVPW